MEQGFKRHNVAWTREKAKSFWNFYSDQNLEDHSFSKQAGNDILNYASGKIPLQGAILDFGCGVGTLMEKIMAKEIVCDGLDFSADSLTETRRRLGESKYLGKLFSSPTEVGDSKYDVVFLIEVVEHLLDEEIPVIGKALARIIKKGGSVVITTPHNETLAKSNTMCPDCGAVFHRVQHVQSWNVENIQKVFNSFGFETVSSEAVLFRPKTIMNFLRDMVQFFKKGKKPHLVYIGRKI